MAKRKADAKLMAAVILIGIPILLLVKLYESIGSGVIVSLAIGIPAVYLGIKLYRAKQQEKDAKQREKELMTKYRDAVTVGKIMSQNVWLGQTAEQLKDSLQSPLAIDNQQLKTKKREVWKYDRRGVNRYGLRVTLENDVVVSWDQKND
jgi:hypothetical protein